MKKHISAIGLLCALFGGAKATNAEVIDSGYVENTGGEPAVVYSTTVQVSGAHAIFLIFQQALLSGDEEQGTGSYLVLTSVLDDGVQTMHASHVAQWLNRSAFFNGDSLDIELVAYPGTGLNRIVFEPTAGGAGSPGSSACIDRRPLSHDPRVARILNLNGYAYCTAFIIDDACHCLLTAGHCAGGLHAIEFNIPLSDDAGRIVHPAPSDQYVVDRSSKQTKTGDEAHGDWCYFGCFPNSTTGLTPFEAQEAYFSIARTPIPVTGQTIRVTGYAQTSPPTPNNRNRALKTATGPYEYYSVSDPEAPKIGAEIHSSIGNSGSPALNLDACEVIGIIGGAGCDTSHGSATTVPDLLAALVVPKGVCSPDCNDNGIPDRCDVDCGDPGGECDVPDCGQSEDCSGDSVPDECEPDCNGNEVADSCDIFYGTSTDCSSNGVPDECEPDCNGNSEPDDCDIFYGTSDDCNCNRIPDDCDVDPYDPDGDGQVSNDCNENAIPDACEEDCNANEIPDDCDLDPDDPDGDGEVSEDCNSNGVPDECLGWPYEPDCNTNGIPDECDVDPTDPDGDDHVSDDCNTNGVPDECFGSYWGQSDCNTNGIPDDCDVDPNDPDGNGQVSEDCTGNGIPDECEPDCNTNDVADSCDIQAGASQDCNTNGVPDECDTGDGTSLDCNTNGVPDECDLAIATSEDCNSNSIPDECDVAGFGDLFVVGVEFWGSVDQYDSVTGAYVGEFVGFIGGLKQPLGMTVHPDGSLLIADEYLHTIRQYDGVTGVYLDDFVAAEAGGLYSPWDLTFAPDGHLLVANVGADGVGTNGILEYGGETGVWLGTFATAELEAPYGLTFGPNGNLFVCDYTTAEIVEFDGDDGAIVGVFANSNGIDLDGPSALAFHPVSGNLFVADAAANDIVEFDGNNGSRVDVFVDDVGGYGAASLMDLKFGPDRHLYVSHSESKFIYKYDGATGELVTRLPESDYSSLKPLRLAFRPAVADCNSNGVPDECDACDQFYCDFDRDCDTDLVDFDGFQYCFDPSGTGASESCQCTFDTDANGTIDLEDYVYCGGQVTGPGAGVGEMMMGGGGLFGGGADEAMMAPAESEDGVVPPRLEDDGPAVLAAAVSIEVRAVGGVEPVTTLTADTPYELHYTAEHDRASLYILGAIATTGGQGLTAASPPLDGPWAATGNFSYEDLAAGGTLVPAVGFPPGYFRVDWITDGFWPDLDRPIPSTGLLCNFTTDGPGELNLVLYMEHLDIEGRHYVAMEAQRTYRVSAP